MATANWCWVCANEHQIQMLSEKTLLLGGSLPLSSSCQPTAKKGTPTKKSGYLSFSLSVVSRIYDTLIILYSLSSPSPLFDVSNWYFLKCIKCYTDSQSEFVTAMQYGESEEEDITTSFEATLIFSANRCVSTSIYPHMQKLTNIYRWFAILLCCWQSGQLGEFSAWEFMIEWVLWTCSPKL